MGSAKGEVGTEAITANVLHFVFVGEWGNSTRGIFFGEGFVEEDEVSKATADRDCWRLEGLEIGLEERISFQIWTLKIYNKVLDVRAL